MFNLFNVLSLGTYSILNTNVEWYWRSTLGETGLGAGHNKKEVNTHPGANRGHLTP